MEKIIGKWIQAKGQAYEGLWFEFKTDGTFTAEYPAMGIVSNGTYQTDGNRIVINQEEHTLGLTGQFKGLYQIDGETLKMALSSGPGQKQPDDLSEARLYLNSTSLKGE